jgi:hypothetical protein
LLPLACLGLAVLAACTARYSFVAGTTTTRALVVALVVALAAIPTRRPTVPALLSATEPAPDVHESVRTIAVLRALRLSGHVNVLEPDHSRAFYAGLDYARVPQWEKNVPFWRFVHERQIGVIVLNWRLRIDPRFKDDPEFVAFDQGAGPREDFDVVPVPGTTAVLAVRRSVPRAE